MLQVNIAILTFGILQCGLLASALLKRKHQFPSTVYLVLFLVVIGLQLMFKLVSKAWLWEHTRTIYMISYNYGYLIGPLIFLFFRSQRRTKIFEKSDLIHFVPFALTTVRTIIDELFGLYLDLPISRFFPWPSLQIVSILCYGAYVWKNYSNRSVKEFLLVVLFAESMIMATILFLIENIESAPDLRIIFGSLTAVVYWVTYKLIVAPDVFYLSTDVGVVRLIANTSPRYSNSGVSIDQHNSIANALSHAIEKDQIFLQPDITIDDVARALSVKKHHLSQVINQQYGFSFTKLVFNWRLDEARRRLLDPSYNDQKISAIAYDLGFSSVSLFTTKFRKQFGMTPAAYRSEGIDNTMQNRA